MILDLNRLIGAVKRELSVREIEGKPAHVLVATRTYATGIDDLWEAITTAERIPRWFLPISGELRLGGTYQFEGNAGGKIVQCEPPRRLGVTWEMSGQVSWVNVELSKEAEARTRLRLEHIACVTDEMWERYGPGAVGVGWESGLLGLDQYFSSDAVVDPQSSAIWLGSAEGRSFIRQTSEAWGTASIAAGTDPASARAAAARTTAAYTGDVEEPAAS